MSSAADLRSDNGYVSKPGTVQYFLSGSPDRETSTGGSDESCPVSACRECGSVRAGKFRAQASPSSSSRTRRPKTTLFAAARNVCRGEGFI